MRDYDGRITFNPRLPKYIDVLRFPLQIRGQRLVVEMSTSEATYLLEEGSQLEIAHQGTRHVLKPGQPLKCKIKAVRRQKTDPGH
jgi:alpha,alpha-trehalose phosphorylase